MIASHSHKAFLLTLLIAIAVVLSVFIFQLKQQEAFVTETYYELVSEAEDVHEKKQTLAETLSELDEALNQKATSNNAFNEANASKNDDFDAYMETITNRTSKVKTPEKESEITQKNSVINRNNTSQFEAINQLISDQKSSSKGNANSSISYALSGRTKVNIPPPVYLCETAGKIIINISVDANGFVTHAKYNKGSSSKNACLIDQAITYAKASRFSVDRSKSQQNGSITFRFSGK